MQRELDHSFREICVDIGVGVDHSEVLRLRVGNEAPHHAIRGVDRKPREAGEAARQRAVRVADPERAAIAAQVNDEPHLADRELVGFRGPVVAEIDGAGHRALVEQHPCAGRGLEAHAGVAENESSDSRGSRVGKHDIVGSRAAGCVDSRFQRGQSGDAHPIPAIVGLVLRPPGGSGGVGLGNRWCGATVTAARHRADRHDDGGGAKPRRGSTERGEARRIQKFFGVARRHRFFNVALREGSSKSRGDPETSLRQETASMEESRSFGFETRQVHAGQRPDPNTGARAVPIYQTTSYVFEDPESAAAYFNLQEYGNTYSRIMNPTVAVFEERIANLEGGCGAVAFASGIAAQAAALFTLLLPGDHVVSSSALYGGTVNQFKHMLRKMSVELTWVNPDDPDEWKAAVRPNTKAFYGETIGNPGGNVLDIHALAAIAHAHDLPLIVDNTFATPYLCRPIEWGADIVLHSATKFIGGHGTSIGGVVVDSGQFNWSNGRFPVIAEPSPAYHGLQFHETFGTYGYLMKLRAETLRDLGAAMSPFNAFLFLQGLETLSLRMVRHVENAAAVASFLESHEQASNVTYPGLRTSRYRPLVDKYLPHGAGAVFSFDCRGGRAAGQDFIRGVSLWSHLANVGDSKSLIIHPASTTHRQLNDDELRAAGVGPGTIRLSVGTESVDDLIWDLEQGFARTAASKSAEVASL